jgi:L-lactate utilization protein LutB
MHVVIVDNGRSRILGQEAFRRSSAAFAAVPA